MIYTNCLFVFIFFAYVKYRVEKMFKLQTHLIAVHNNPRQFVVLNHASPRERGLSTSISGNSVHSQSPDTWRSSQGHIAWRTAPRWGWRSDSYGQTSKCDLEDGWIGAQNKLKKMKKIEILVAIFSIILRKTMRLLMYIFYSHQRTDSNSARKFWFWSFNW